MSKNGECRISPLNVNNAKYVSERYNLSLHSCAFGPSPVYVDDIQVCSGECPKERRKPQFLKCNPYF